MILGLAPVRSGVNLLHFLDQIKIRNYFDFKIKIRLLLILEYSKMSKIADLGQINLKHTVKYSKSFLRIGLINPRPHGPKTTFQGVYTTFSVKSLSF